MLFAVLQKFFILLNLFKTINLQSFVTKITSSKGDILFWKVVTINQLRGEGGIKIAQNTSLHCSLLHYVTIGAKAV
jgi:hypothetical protein